MSRDIKDFKGVIPAVISVFHKDEELDEQGTREFIRYLMSMDIGGLYVTGSTGETWLMTAEERMRQVEIVMEEVGDKVPVVVHVGAMSTREAIRYLMPRRSQMGASRNSGEAEMMISSSCCCLPWYQGKRFFW